MEGIITVVFLVVCIGIGTQLGEWYQSDSLGTASFGLAIVLVSIAAPGFPIVSTLALGLAVGSIAFGMASFLS